MAFLGSLFSGGSTPQMASTTAIPTTNANQTAASQGLTSLQGQLQGQNAVGNQNTVFAQQQALAQQLQNLANGQGPNPALNQLNQTTGQNVQQQAALQAGQRGSGQNVGLAARNAALAGTNAQQQAVGQAATLEAQQQLGAMGALGQQQALEGQTAQQEIANQTGVANQLGQLGLAQSQQALTQNMAANQNAVQQQMAANQINASQYGTNLNAAGGFLSGISGGLLSTGGSGGQQQQQTQNGKPTGGLLGTLFAKGGEVKNLPASGGANAAVPILKENYKGRSKIGHYLAHGGHTKAVQALLSPGEVYLSPDKARKAKGGKISPLDGEVIKGAPKVPGAVNSYSNDTVHKKVHSGGIVIPRSVTKSQHPEANAKKFIDTLKKKK